MTSSNFFIKLISDIMPEGQRTYPRKLGLTFEAMKYCQNGKIKEKGKFTVVKYDPRKRDKNSKYDVGFEIKQKTGRKKPWNKKPDCILAKLEATKHGSCSNEIEFDGMDGFQRTELSIGSESRGCGFEYALTQLCMEWQIQFKRTAMHWEET